MSASDLRTAAEPAWDPAEAHRALRDARAREAAEGEARGRRVSNVRLAVFLAGVGVAFAVFGRLELPVGWLLVPLVAFAALVVHHDRVLRGASQAQRGQAFHQAGLLRLEGRFLELPCGQPELNDLELASHPYADDLDCLGPGSLFHRIDTARTRVGQNMLARWLLEHAPPDEIRARQRAVRDLRPRLALREALDTLPAETKEALESDALLRWAAEPPMAFSGAERRVASALPLLSLAAIGAWWFAGLPLFAMGLAFGVQAGFASRLRSRVRAVIAAVELPARDLSLLVGLLETVEGERFEAERLVALRASLVEKRGASQRLRLLRRRVDLLDARRNQLFAPIAWLFLWATHTAFAIEDWRAEDGPHVREWIEGYGEIEALLSLAAYAYERPSDAFPEIVAADSVLFDARGLGHPLLPVDQCVRNDLCLDPSLRLVLISGSNMSGKSTLLRAVGVNAVLAQAGAPVCARSLRISPLQVGASVQLRDSLLGGQSRFYAEIQRLERVYELARLEQPPVLFLLDEILHGTNAQERRTGGEAVVRGLLAHGASGLVTTHDLALAEMVDEHAPVAANRHLGDEVEEGALRFDYTLREGVAGQGNALALMRAVGLPV